MGLRFQGDKEEEHMKIYVSGRIGSGPDKQDNMKKMNFYASNYRQISLCYR